MDSGGNVYVLDSDLHSIVVFDPDGNFLRMFGREGQGPGELQRPTAIAVVGSLVVVYEDAKRRFLVWRDDGVFVSEIASPFEESPISISSLGNELIVSSASVQDADALPLFQVRFHALDLFGERLIDLGAFPVKRIQVHPRRVGQRLAKGYNTTVARSRFRTPSFSILVDGSLVVNPGHLPEIAKVSRDGEIVWVIHMPVRTREASTREIDHLTRPKARGVTLKLSDLVLPESMPAFARVLTDGRGNIYAIEAPQGGMIERDSVLTTHVFSRDGDYLGSANQAVINWQAAFDDFVFTIEADVDTGENVVVRRQMAIGRDSASTTAGPSTSH